MSIRYHSRMKNNFMGKIKNGSIVYTPLSKMKKIFDFWHNEARGYKRTSKNDF